MSLAEFWMAFVGHSAFLLCVLPLFGASMVAASAGLGREVVRRTALTNVVLTAALAILMVASYQPDRRSESGLPGVIQMATYLHWIGEEADSAAADAEPQPESGRQRRRVTVSLTVGIDGLNLWLIAATCWLMVPVVLAGAEVDRERTAAFYTSLLLLQSLLIAAFAALDAMLFVFCVEASALPLWYLIGRFGGPDRQPAARKLFAFLLAGGLALFVGVLGMAVATAAQHANDAPVAAISFFLPRLLLQPQVAGWIAAALVVGLWIRGGLFPVHTWFPAGFSAAPTSIRILLAAAIVPLGGYGLARFVLPLVTGAGGPEPPISVAESTQAVAIAGAVYCGVLAVAQSDLSRLLAYAGLCQAALAAAGLTAGNRIGATGGLLHLFGVGVAVAVLAILLGWLGRAFASDDVRSFGGMARGRPRFAAVLTVSALGLIGVPGLSGFSGLLLILWGVADGPAGDPRLARAAACLLATFLCAWAIVAMLVRMLFGPPREPTAFPFGSLQGPGNASVLPTSARTARSGPADLGGRELVASVPLIVLMLWIGLWPGFFTDRIEPTLEQTPAAFTATLDRQRPTHQASAAASLTRPEATQ